MALFPAIDVTINNTNVFQIESIMLAYCFTANLAEPEV
jgi:hypothetical protein